MRVYSETQMKEMRLFYEAWTILDPNSLVATGESSKSTSTLAELQTDDFQEVAISTIANVELGTTNPSVITDELLSGKYKIDIYHSLQIPNLADFPIEDFYKVPMKDCLPSMALKCGEKGPINKEDLIILNEFIGNKGYSGAFFISTPLFKV